MSFALSSTGPDFALLADLIPQIVWLTDPAGNHTYFNRRWTEFTGFTPEQSFGPDVWNQLLHPDDQARARQRWQHSLDTGEAYEIEYRFRDAAGGYHWFLGQAQPQHDPVTGQISGWFGTCTDIHEQKLTRQRLEESEGRFRLMADSAPVLIWISGLDKGCFYFNRPWLTYTGRTLEQEQGNGWAEGVHPDDFDRCLAIYVTSFDQRLPFQMEYRLRRAEGDYHWLLDTGVPRYDAAGEFQGYIGSCVDIEALKEAEDALRNAYEDLETKVTFRNLELEREVRALRGQ